MTTITVNCLLQHIFRTCHWLIDIYSTRYNIYELQYYYISLILYKMEYLWENLKYFDMCIYIFFKMAHEIDRCNVDVSFGWPVCQNLRCQSCDPNQISSCLPLPHLAVAFCSASCFGGFYSSYNRYTNANIVTQACLLPGSRLTWIERGRKRVLYLRLRLSYFLLCAHASC